MKGEIPLLWRRLVLMLCWLWGVISLLAACSVTLPSARVVPPTPVSRTTPPATLSSPTATPFSSSLNLPTLQQTMLRLINRDRQSAGLPPVAWDNVAARAGQSHAEEMLAGNYMSHCNQAGYGPDHRYAFAGGLDAVFENVYSSYYRYSDGQGVPISEIGRASCRERV